MLELELYLLGLFSEFKKSLLYTIISNLVPAIIFKSFYEISLSDLGRIHQFLTNVPSIKCVIKKPSCFSFEFNANLWSCSYLCVLNLHQIFQMKNKKVFLMTHLTDGLSINGRWIQSKNDMAIIIISNLANLVN